jgi:D-tyrosyl-tRNA(Tyr) deacylase
MRVVIQRVQNASVVADGEETGSIGQGLLVLAGFEESDAEDDLNYIVGKIARLRIFNDADGVMNLSVQDIGGEVLLVSQFTLHAATKKGNRPSYIRAARPETAFALYERFHRMLEQELGKPVPTGRFGAHMEVRLLNDGPVTIWMDSKE